MFLVKKYDEMLILKTFYTWTIKLRCFQPNDDQSQSEIFLERRKYDIRVAFSDERTLVTNNQPLNPLQELVT